MCSILIKNPALFSPGIDVNDRLLELRVVCEFSAITVSFAITIILNDNLHSVRSGTLPKRSTQQTPRTGFKVILPQRRAAFFVIPPPANHRRPRRTEPPEVFAAPMAMYIRERYGVSRDPRARVTMVSNVRLPSQCLLGDAQRGISYKLRAFFNKIFL
ncbi:hypothetical protein EVAR_30318_1 [Eumeta japonica]|uniref:Uncharacterized protein n=1 Tax=Eumeta variegata TaxID=151549 RepID=A0A4C1WBS4_EUMVA|nr:hypothetical protein EVAR_30318_1 [Eumeta japonica]